MNTRQLGNQGLIVSEMGLGCMGMHHGYGQSLGLADITRLVDRAVDLGCNLFDTAPIYGFENEELLGAALQPYKANAVIATKFGVTGLQNVAGQLVPLLDSSPESIRAQLEGSLKRLRVDCIDLFYQHRLDPNVEPEVVADVMSQLVAEGKIRHWGLSNVPVDYVRRAHAVCPISAVEDQYSMMWRAPERGLFPLCEELGIGFMAYSPLGSGFLSGAVTQQTEYREGDFRGLMGRFRPEVMQQNQALLDLIAQTAEHKSATSAQIVLAWALAQKPYLVPLPGTTKEHRLEENFKAADIRLQAEELAHLNAALEKIPVDETFF